MTTKTRKPTKAMLETENEVLRAALEDAMGQLKAAHRKIAHLEGQYEAIERDIAMISSRKHLLHKCRRLNMDGVPCNIRGNAIVHRVSGAVLAQIKE